MATPLLDMLPIKIRARRGMAILSTEGMGERERYLHEKYGSPANIDLSDEHIRLKEAELASRVDIEVAEISERYRQWCLEKDGTGPHEPSELFRSVPAEVVKRARAMCDAMEQGIMGFFVVGCRGSGKTSTAEHALSYWCGDGWSGVKVTEKQLVDALRGCVQGVADRADVFARYATPGLLVLDDMGVMKPTDWAMAEVTDLLNTRMEAGLRTVVTSNLTAEALRDRIAKVDSMAAERIESRLRALQLLTLPNVDHREAVRVRPADEMLAR